MYRWIIFLHQFAVLAFMIAHGVQAAVMLRMRAEADPSRNLALFAVLPSLRLLRLLLAAVIVTGLISGFMLPWWQQGWVWASLVLLAVITLAMRQFGSGYFSSVARAASRALTETNQPSLDAFAVARGTWHPLGTTAIGMGGIAIILWLMMVKPF
jgi:hypothetical protein